MGQPKAARISFLVQPAQHLYLRGSEMEMAKLSPLLSRPCPAHDGHRVKKLRPLLRFLPVMCSRIEKSVRLGLKFRVYCPDLGFREGASSSRVLRPDTKTAISSSVIRFSRLR